VLALTIAATFVHSSFAISSGSHVLVKLPEISCTGFVVLDAHSLLGMMKLDHNATRGRQGLQVFSFRLCPEAPHSNLRTVWLRS
jgi:hypothetical protein